MTPESGTKRRVLLAAFNGELMCFAHVLLNALDMAQKGYEVKIVIEGSATRLIGEMVGPGKPFANLYLEAKDKGLIDGVCRACSVKMGTLEKAREQGLPLCGEMKGHPSLARYLEQGYAVIAL